MMDILANLGGGFGIMFTPMAILLCLLGVFAGVTFGAIPGISPSMAVALLLPMTFTLEPVLGMVLLLGAYKGANYGGSVSAVLINTPGTPSAAVTAFDGYPMTKNGRVGEAMGISLYASVFGGIIGTVVLIAFAQPLARVALQFWPSEYFALTILGLTTVATMGGKNWQKALVAVVFGLLLNTIGMDPIAGTRRFTFGDMRLLDGLSLIPAIIGLFALGELFYNIEHYSKGEKFDKLAYKLPKVRYYLTVWKNIVRSGVLGTIIGIFPGAGGTIAAFISYDVEKRCSKKPEEFGKGSPEGVAAAESSNSASAGGALVPLLALGIPGSATAAVLLGSLLVHGLNPGPEMFVEEPELVYGMFASMFMANAFILLVGLVGANLFVRVTDLKKTLLYPLIFTFAIVGSYAVTSSMYSVVVCVVFGVIGWIFRRYDYPPAPVVLGIVLGSLAELSFRQALIIGGVESFYKRPLTLIMLAIAVAAVAAPIVKKRMEEKKAADSRF
ncbi:putative tricarboxylic transport membrane protein [Alkalispirochaeta americana]|uniref:Putative tricarboxylic transport membrane protein n=1 Tax=Alkalispirochaeta americana TaxID=159291 RepID=A0A1N6UBR2_9SPIO|nr:tripartite tricarboxylate transporter permease [Alkalispirochaeta americana]SIQ63023.1 putative tricarboxylic transport membrane protein [Alkalispirochaeta americana]